MKYAKNGRVASEVERQYQTFSKITSQYKTHYSESRPFDFKLLKDGYGTKKGKFGFVKVETQHHRRHHKGTKKHSRRR
jgi:hypothetical protein